MQPDKCIGEVCDTILKRLYHDIKGKDLSAEQGLEVVELVEKVCNLGGDQFQIIQRRGYIYSTLCKSLWQTGAQTKNDRENNLRWAKENVERLEGLLASDS